MTQRSIHNNTNIPLTPFGIFTGQWEPTSTYLEISTYVNSSAYLAIGIQQSQDASAVVINTTYNYTPTEDVTVFNVGVGLPFYRVVITNEANVQVAHMAITTILSAVPNTVDASIIGVVTVTGNVSVVNDVSCNILSAPHLSYLTDSVLDAGIYKPTDDGVSTHFEITASAVNNAAVYYADETKGVDVAGGWQFTSVLAPGGTRNTQINWYMYQPTTDVVITDLSNNPTNTYYTIVDNVGVQFPMIYIYTKPTTPATKTTGGTAGSSWYQSKFVYQANQVGTVGTYLLYAGANPTTIRPDLTHINLRQLDSLCLGTLQPNEIVMSAALLTSSNLESPAGDFSLTMSKFGVVVAPVDTALRVDATGALTLKIASVVVTGTVAVSSLPALATGTNSIGKVSEITNALPAGSNALGSVSVSALPAITGSVSVSSLPALATGTNSIGKVSEITNALPTGTNALGSVSVSALPAITGSVSVSSLPALATGTNSIGKISEITNALPTGTNALGSVSVSALPAITGSVSVSSLPALATGTNSIGKISEITNVVTTKITNSTYTNARDLALSNTGVVVKGSAGTLRGITCANTDNTAYTYVKIYDKATAPTSADTPVVTIPVYKNTSETYDFFQLQMNNGISMRATTGVADSDNTAVVGMVVFVSYDGV